MKKKKAGQLVIDIIIILLVMVLSVFFRIMAKGAVDEYRGMAFYDEEEGLPFLTEMDSYYHLRMTQDILDYGHPGETVVNGENWDTLSYAPEGRSAKDYRPLMAYAAIAAYKVASVFGYVSLYTIAYYLGTFLSALAVIPAYIMGRHFAGTLAGAAASILAALNYGYFIHTVPGFYDTDMVISFASGFALCFGLLFADSILGVASEDGEKSSLLRKIIFGCLFGLSIYALYLSWNVYSLYVGIYVAAIVAFLVLLAVFKKRDNENTKGKVVKIIAVLAGVTAFTVLINPGLFKDFASYAASVFAGDSGSLFPDAYVSVSEMRKPSLLAGGFTGLFQMKVLSESDIGVINAVGGFVPLACALCALVTMVHSLIKKRVRFDYVLIIVWFLASAVLAARGFRFIVLFAFPVAVLAGTFLGKLYLLMKGKKMMDYPVFAGMAAILLLFPALYGSYKMIGDSMPVINYTINDSVTYIRDMTSENTIIASWWDYGYYYEHKAERRTVFDGGSQNGNRVFWIGRALATDDEVLSANILRMIAGSGDKATENMLNSLGNSNDTISLMIELLTGDKEGAHKRLVAEGLSDELSGELSSLLFPEVENPVMMVITPDMQGICGWFARFGFWNEKNVDHSFNVMMLDQEFSFVNGLAGWSMNLDGKDVKLFVEETEDGFKAYTTLSDKEEAVQPYPVDKILVREYGTMMEYDMEIPDDDRAGLTVIIDRDYDTNLISLISSNVSDSVFGKMFYYEGEGLEQYSRDFDADGYCRLYYLY